MPYLKLSAVDIRHIGCEATAYMQARRIKISRRLPLRFDTRARFIL